MFAERQHGRAAGLKRSKMRAAALAPFLGLDLPALRERAPATIVVTGSKGKGTAAVYASAALAANGLRVGTLTSPGLRTNRERIRVDGDAIAPGDYRALIARVAAALEEGRDVLSQDGYLAPTGLFTLAAARHFLDTRCDAWVLEAGMGGASDEVSLFAPGVLVLTPVFAEHIGIIGDTVSDIARDKLGAAGPETRAVLTLRQPHPEVQAALRQSSAPLRVVRESPLPDAVWPPSLVGDNARLGVSAALELLSALGITPDVECTRSTLGSVALPGRMSVHRRGDQQWRADTATNGAAARAAISWSDSMTPATATLVCVPDGKDRDGVRDAVHRRHHISLRTDAAHLSFTEWPEPLPSLAEVDLGALGPRVLSLGTVHFVGDVMDALGVATERAFTPPAAGARAS